MRSRIGYKVLGLCALVVGVMAVGAGTAQASTWMVNGANLANGAESAAVEISLVGNLGQLLVTLNGLEIEVNCTSASLVNVKLKGPETTSTGGKAKFEGCKAFKRANLENLECRVNSGTLPEGTVETTEFHALLELHETASKTTEGIILIIPDNAEKRFMTLKFKECVLPGSVPVLGSLALKDAKGEGEVERTEHEATELASLTKLFVISGEPGNEASLDGKVNFKLATAEKFSGLKE